VLTSKRDVEVALADHRDNLTFDWKDDCVIITKAYDRSEKGKETWGKIMAIVRTELAANGLAWAETVIGLCHLKLKRNKRNSQQKVNQQRRATTEPQASSTVHIVANNRNIIQTEEGGFLGLAKQGVKQ